MTIVRGTAAASKKRCSASGRLLQRSSQRGKVQVEIQKTRPGDFHPVAPLRNLKLSEHVRGQLPRVEFPRPGQRHEGVALVIPELRVRAGTHEHGRGVRIRQNRLDGFLQAEFDLFVW